MIRILGDVVGWGKQQHHQQPSFRWWMKESEADTCAAAAGWRRFIHDRHHCFQGVSGFSGCQRKSRSVLLALCKCPWKCPRRNWCRLNGYKALFHASMRRRFESRCPCVRDEIGNRMQLSCCVHAVAFMPFKLYSCYSLVFLCVVFAELLLQCCIASIVLLLYTCHAVLAFHCVIFWCNHFTLLSSFYCVHFIVLKGSFLFLLLLLLLLQLHFPH